MSDPGEVRPLAAWALVALSTCYLVEDDAYGYVAWSPSGARFRDGTTRRARDTVDA